MPDPKTEPDSTSSHNVVLRVAVPVPLAETFDYRWQCREAPPQPGCRVKVPFGRGTRIGLVIAHASSSALPDERLKSLAEVLDTEPLIGAELLETLSWAANYYHHPIGEVVRHAMPGLLRKGRPATPRPGSGWRITQAGSAASCPELAARAPRQARLLAHLARSRATSTPALRQEGFPSGFLQGLAAKGWIEEVATSAAAVHHPPSDPQLEDRSEDLDSARETETGAWRDADTTIAKASDSSTAERSVNQASPPELTEDQCRVLEELANRPDGYSTFVLHGATGSGKTEIFLRLIAEELEAGRQTLLLVPEIGLTPQLFGRLRERFGDRLTVMHSGLADGERLAAWRNARTGAAGIVVGTRSAVFSELHRPGLIIIDEEHDPSYKQQQGFRYNARDIAVLRAKRLRIPVVLASATPSLESVRNAREGRYQLLQMPNRIGTAGQPSVRLVDLNLFAAQRSLSAPLITAIGKHLAAGNQVLLFLNRRGFAPVLLCTQCGTVEQCSRCDARLTVHASAGRLRCHHCGAESNLNWACQACGSERIAVGAGTQRVTDELRSLYPEHEIARLDRDATARKGALDAVLEGVRSGKTRILVGTQMLTKGHDFPRVTLVGVLNADQGLFGTELRSDEQLAQTLVQVAGRAGRGESPGEVLIQTHYPAHPLLQRLLNDGYAAFAELALNERQRTGWPPYSHVALWRAEATRREDVFRFLGRIVATGRKTRSAVDLLGPASDPMERKAGRFRGRVLLQARGRAPLHALLGDLLHTCRAWPEARRVQWSIDVDPLDI